MLAPKTYLRSGRWVRWQGMATMALRSLQSHKLRSLLTVMGLVFGVSSVIIMLAVAEGAGRASQQQIQSLGVTNVLIRSVKPALSKTESERQRVLSYGLTRQDAICIKQTIPFLKRSTAFRAYSKRVGYQAVQLDVRMVGVEPNYALANQLNVALGRFVESDDMRRANNVCVVGHQVAGELFGYQSPLGKDIRVGDRSFTVIGVMEDRQASAGIGNSLAAQDFNLDVYIPASTDTQRMGDLLIQFKSGQSSFERLELSQVTLQVQDEDKVESVAAAVESLLKKRHTQDDFRVVIPLELLEQAKQMQRVYSLVLGSIAAISLLVGGIGIMNIMLASVVERTREIGIRRALGATRGDIIAQFLIETVVLSLLGGLIGVTLGLTVPHLLTYFSGVETVILLWMPLVAVLVAVSTGVVFGVYPARQAAYLDPIEALRHS